MYFLRRWDWVLQVTAIVLCSYFTAKALTIHAANLLETMEAPVAGLEAFRPKPVPREAAPGNEKDGGLERYDAVLKRNVFNSKAVDPANDGPSGADFAASGPLGPAVETGLDIKVRSTIVVGSGEDRRSSAIVLADKKKWRAYFVGDEESFAPGARLLKVGKDRIEFVHKGRLEYKELTEEKNSVFRSSEEVFGDISMTKAGGTSSPRTSPSSSADTIVVAQKDVDQALQNLHRLQGEVRIVPNFQGGKVEGFKVLSVRPGGLISKLGVRRNDVLQRVNGQDLDMRNGLEMFTSLKDSRTFSLEILRGGQSTTLEYEIR